MDQNVAKIHLQNERDTPCVFVIEPWGEDYTLLPGEEATLVAFGTTELPWFDLVMSEDHTLVSCERASEFKMMQGANQLACGHHRIAQDRVGPASGKAK